MPLRALVLNCTLKRSPAPSNTAALASVLSDDLADGGAVCQTIRVVDHDVLPKRPGPRPAYLGIDEGHDWSARTARTAAANLITVAEALAAHPLPKPSS